MIRDNQSRCTVMLEEHIPIFPWLLSKQVKISYLELRHKSGTIRPQTFSVEPRKLTITTKILKPRALQVEGNEQEQIKMKIPQIPVVMNNATTVHELQGRGVDKLVVQQDWNYETKWIYVLLSRIKNRDELFCRNKLR